MSVRVAYKEAARIIGPEAECFEAAQAVEELRLAWRPKQVRVVLLAESHVWTSPADLKARVMLPVPMHRPGLPARFARFVYSLGYGEPGLLTRRVRLNPGTWQYWRLFRDAARSVESPCRLKGNLAEKLAILDDLKNRGIWLVDACVTALYKPGAKQKLALGGDYNRVLRKCWEAHVGKVIADCRPSGVLIVGKGVNAAIGEAVRRDLKASVQFLCLPQPNARLSAGEIARNRASAARFCRRHRRPDMAAQAGRV